MAQSTPDPENPKALTRQLDAQLSYVYVGGLLPCVTNEALEEIFGQFGRILYISIRLVYGCALEMGGPPKVVENTGVYASVEYLNTSGAQGALSLDSVPLFGVPMTVSRRIYDNPEFRHCFHRSVNEYALSTPIIVGDQ